VMPLRRGYNAAPLVHRSRPLLQEGV
jgi:hypothetical protein